MYPFGKIEKKWREKWLKSKIYEPNLKTAKKPFYNLMMFPYPSAEGLHVGNVYAFTGSDIYGRFQRMHGNDVFQPIGLDGFGIHSENYAMKIGAHPVSQAKVTEKNFYRQLQLLGNGFAWNNRLETYDPDYYKWTQWIFIQMFKHGLAYRKKQSVNWCPSCKTVLADEQVIGGKCERCNSEAIKKDLEQWFFKITKYADRLLNNIEKIDWSEKIKIAQRNWIGKSEGASITFKVKDSKEIIEVFTTRPDTLFGATYMVLAPECELINKLKPQIENWSLVSKYVNSAKGKSESERIEEGNVKMGIELKGIQAINPATKKPIPVWIADYVIASYGTGAIMAVPAHDERDMEFARKFNLPIQQVIEPLLIDTGADAPRDNLPFIERDSVLCIVKHWSENKYLRLIWKKYDWRNFVVGGINKNEKEMEAAMREIKEETGYTNAKFIRYIGGTVHNRYYAAHKNENRHANFKAMYFELTDGKNVGIGEEEKQMFDVVWQTRKEIDAGIEHDVTSGRYFWELFNKADKSYYGNGAMINSGKFNSLPSEEAKWEITKFVDGKKKSQYKLRDWLISRQRYWGPPIPMIYCGPPAGGCGWQPVPEKDLPLKLPFVKDFRPKGKGESPLASVKSFYETKCPKCKGKARRETDVSDTFFDSSWYFLRYPSIGEKKVPWSKEMIKKWLPVDMYIGGPEHAVLHLLYTRFITMVLKDMGILHFEEPFKTFRAHGMLISEGAKMSKSKGNVVNPDEYIKKFGSDTLRMYLMFIGPFEDGGDWRDSGITGVVRFLNRVWKLGNMKFKKSTKISPWLNQSIRKVTDHISNLRYNTAISELMIVLNKFESEENLSLKDFEAFLLLLAPFAPFITEELWGKLGHKKSIHIEKWPKQSNEKLIETYEIIFMVNGKFRGKVDIKFGITENEARKLATRHPIVAKYLNGQKIKKVIFVPNRLINFVI